MAPAVRVMLWTTQTQVTPGVCFLPLIYRMMLTCVCRVPLHSAHQDGQVRHALVLLLPPVPDLTEKNEVEDA